MTVLFLSPSAALGGAERVLLTMTAALRRQCPSTPVHVLALDHGPLTALLESQGVGVTCLPLPERLAQLGDSQFALGAVPRFGLGLQGAAALPNLCGYLRRLRAAVQRLRPALVHSNGIKSHLLAHLAGLDARPLLWHVHDFYSARRFARRLLGWAVGRLPAAIAVSAAVAADFRAISRGRPIVVVPNAIDTSHFRPRAVEAGRLDQLAGLPVAPPGVLRIGMVATYARWKGHDVFLRAAALLRDAPVRFYLIGGPVYQTQGSQFSADELRSLGHVMDLDGKVGFIDFQRDPSEIYPALDVVVHASVQPEPFGLTIAEAMACGRAVVVAQAGGAAELFTPGYEALAVPPGDSRALVEAMQTLIQDASLRERLGAAARAAAVRRLDHSRLGPQLIRIYDQVRGVSHPSAHEIADSKPINGPLDYCAVAQGGDSATFTGHSRAPRRLHKANTNMLTVPLRAERT
jgi:glycosyltransferase involved in cell wall biosynthesis